MLQCAPSWSEQWQRRSRSPVTLIWVGLVCLILFDGAIQHAAASRAQAGAQGKLSIFCTKALLCLRLGLRIPAKCLLLSGSILLSIAWV
ncbi:unnamed protein product [Urochloa humidicola]